MVIVRNSPRSIKKRVFSHDVTVAILVSQNNEAAAMLVSQTTPVLNSFLMQTLYNSNMNLRLSGYISFRCAQVSFGNCETMES